MKYTKIAIIGGSGLEKLDLFDSSEMLHPQTPYGQCSSPVVFGKIGDKEVAINPKTNKIVFQSIKVDIDESAAKEGVKEIINRQREPINESI